MKGNFQIILIILFIIAALFGILVFSGVIPLGGDNGEQGQGTVVVWGTLRSADVLPLVEVINAQNPSFIVKYEEKNPNTFDQTMLEALASGTGPDMFFLSDELAFKYKNKVTIIPPGSYPVSAFQSNFVGAGEVFLTSSGVLAFPVLVDPLVMYYDRSTLDSNGIIYPPKTWTEFAQMVPTLTKKDEAGKILKSAVALGHFSNVTNAKGIISMLFMQGGNPIVTEQNGTFLSTLGNYNDAYNLPSILEFYTDFADPLSPAYSWNKSLSASRDAFSAGNTAFYFGYASELAGIAARNPNQDFLAVAVPQIEGAPNKQTSAKVTGIAISNATKNLNTSLIVSTIMSSGDFPKNLAMKLNVAPARRDLIQTPPNDSFSPVFYSSALFAKAWMDPAPSETSNAFEAMIEGVLSNRRSLGEAINEVGSKLSLMLIR